MNTISRRRQIIIWMSIALISIALAIEFMLSSQPERPFGHTQVAHVVGWLGFGMIALTFVYPIKRWLHPNQVWPKDWFQIHQIMGIAGPLLIVVHSGAHFHAAVPVLALVALLLVVFSGITGQALHYLAFRTLYEQRHELAAQGLTEEAVESHLHNLALEEETLRSWRCVHGPLTVTCVVLTLIHIGGALYFGGV
ncbi:hypothetical protein [Candidatus Nitrospira salsa]|nr:MAG: hypothetical protein NPIRA04_02790 [Nitrospirales bacterium]